MSLPLIFPNVHLPYLVVQGLMRNRPCMGGMAEEPSVDAFMRHLQVCVEEARTIADAKEREQRLWKLESALQEAIIYKNRIEELQRHGIDPFDWLNPNLVSRQPLLPRRWRR